jgi:hypothetical protein
MPAAKEAVKDGAWCDPDTQSKLRFERLDQKNL